MGTMRRAMFAAAFVIGGAALFAPLPAGAATTKKELTPVFECAAPNSDGTFTAFFGYSNETGNPMTIPTGSRNKVEPSPGDRGQPVQFSVGRHVAVFSVRLKSGETVTWRIGTQHAASISTVLCAAPAELAETSTWLALPGAALASVGLWAFVQRRRRGGVAPLAGSAPTAAA
jgi:hypothetical protein